ncbi:MAG: sulfatase [Planctomycetota bacterium]
MFRLAIPLLVAVSLTHSAVADEKPNLVFVIADDCTFRDIGCYGGQAITPNIDGLATEGMLFTRCYQSAPMCSPKRHNIYSGQYPVKSGAYPNHTRVNPGVDTVVQYLGELGYRVGQSGKSHVNPNSIFTWETLGKDKNPDFDQMDAFLSECRANSQPFCLLVCSNEPHTPWNKGDPSQYPLDAIELPPYLFDTPETREGMSRYLAEITYYDWQVGQTLALLDKHEVADNTLVVVVSEQGSSMPFAKWTCYDSGLQSACLVRWPGKVKPGQKNHALIEYVDFLPTFVEAAGGVPGASLDGKSLLPVFSGKQQHKEFVFGEMTTRGIINGSTHFGIRSVRSSRFKYIWNFTPDVPFQNACVKSPEFKSWVREAEKGNEQAKDLVHRYQHRPGIELYDVVADPFEMNNLAADPEHATTLTSVRDELDAWMKRCGDEGQATELQAHEHQGVGRKKNASGQKKARKQRSN